MVLFPRSGLGRLLLLSIIISTLFYLVLNLSSFGGSSWIQLSTINYNFGLWKICPSSISGSCTLWTNTVKPSYVKSSQALEIIALVFYIIAACLIVLGILNIKGLSYEIPFIGAAGLLFISFVFIATSLGIMSKQGRSGDPYAYHGWSWWTGLVGFIMTLITFISLIGLILDMNLSDRNQISSDPLKQKTNQPHNQVYHHQSSHPMTQNAPPIISGNQYQNNSHQGHYPHPGQHSQQYSHPGHYEQQYSHPGHYGQPYSHPGHHEHYNPQSYLHDYYPNSMMAYGDHSPAEQYFHDHSSPGMYSDLAHEYGFGDQYHGHFHTPYQNYNNHSHNPYIIHDYL